MKQKHRYEKIDIPCLSEEIKKLNGRSSRELKEQTKRLIDELGKKNTRQDKSGDSACTNLLEPQ